MTSVMKTRQAAQTRLSLLLILASTALTAGCTLGASTGAGPVLRIPQAPPRVVSELPPDTSGLEVSPPEQAVSDATAERPLAAEPLPPPNHTDRAPIERADEVASDETEEQADEIRVRRRLTAAPDEEVDQRTVERSLQDTATRLGRVDRSELNSAERAQYDTARRFLEQAESALAAGSVVFAHYLGQKALTLVRGL